MKHIRNSIKGIFILEHESAPDSNTLFTDFNEQIPNASLCVDKEDSKLYILNGTNWSKIASFDNENMFIPLSGTENNIPVIGDIEFKDNVSIYNEMNRLLFNKDYILYTIKMSNTNYVIYKMNHNMLRYNYNTNTIISTNSINNTINHAETELKLENSSYNNSVFGYNKNLYLNNSGINLLNNVNQTVNLSNAKLNILTGDFQNLNLDNLEKNLILNKITGNLSNINNVYNNIINIEAIDINISDTYRNTLSGKLSDNYVIETLYDNKIHIVSVVDDIELKNLVNNIIQIKNVSKNINNIDSSLLLMSNYESTINNLKYSIIVGNSINSNILSEYLHILGNLNNSNITSNYSLLKGNFNNLNITGDNINILGDYSDASTKGIDGDNIYIFGNSTIDENINVNNLISIGDSYLTNNITDNNIIISTNNSIVNSNNYENNVFINCKNVVADGSNSVYVPNIKLVDNENIGTIEFNDSTASCVYTLPNRSGEIALNCDLGFVKHTWDVQVSEYLKTSGTIFRGGRFMLEIEFVMRPGSTQESVDIFYGLNKGYAYFERYSDIILEKGTGDKMSGTWTINKFFDNNTAYTSSENVVGQNVGDGYIYETTQDENGVYKFNTSKLASIADTITFVWSNAIDSSDGTKRSLILEGTVRGI